MDEYDLLTEGGVNDFVRSRPALAALVDVDTLVAREVGDGNLNLVFVARDGRRRGLCLKQSLPYVRLIGESWPLTPRRADIEAALYRVAAEVAPGAMPAFFDFDDERHVLVIEDLSDWKVWRAALNNGEIHDGAAGAVGRYIAHLAVLTSPFHVPNEIFRHRSSEAVNAEMCRITEDLVFTEPFEDHPNNKVHADVEDELHALRSDPGVRRSVSNLKFAFLTRAEALLHGDLHTGSVMVTSGTNGQASAKPFDAEFACYGPVAFDLGMLAANFLFARVRAVVLGRGDAFQDHVAALIPEMLDAFATQAWAVWPASNETSLSEEAFAAWLDATRIEALGFAGCEAVRRIVGLAKVADIESLPDDAHVSAARTTLETARTWLTAWPGCRSVDDAVDVFASVAWEAG